eukprot:c22252_g1_i2 orf=479-1093(-)
MFDFRSGKWRPMPVCPPTSFFNSSCAVVDGKLYTIGGFVGLADISSTMWAYNMRTNAWEKVAQMAESREACACGVIKGCIYVAGGLCRYKSDHQRVNTAEVYVPQEDRWHFIASMREGHSCCASAVYGGKLYVIGGYGAHGVLQSVEMYDPIDGVWSRRADMPAMWVISGCAVIGFKIYVVGSNIMDRTSKNLLFTMYKKINGI